MELGSILVVLIIYFFVAASKASAKKGTKTQNRAPGQPVRRPRPMASRPAASPGAAPAVPAPEASPVPAPVPAQADAGAPVRPTVHVSPHHHEDMYAGSMNAPEVQGNPDAYGEMPSEHSAELFVEPDEAEEPVQGEGVRLNFSPDSLVNAFILQEVLKRPQERHSGRQGA